MTARLWAHRGQEPKEAEQGSCLPRTVATFSDALRREFLNVVLVPVLRDASALRAYAPQDEGGICGCAALGLATPRNLVLRSVGPKDRSVSKDGHKQHLPALERELRRPQHRGAIAPLRNNKQK